MPQQNPPWDTDPALTQRGVGPLGHTSARAATSDDPARYRLGSRVGETGQVYEAQNSRYAGRLVVKLFPFAASLAPSAVAAFTREAQTVAGLRHPHIAQLIHAGAFSDGTPFVAMERLSGQTLDQRIAGRGGLPITEALPLVRGIASALSAAHVAGVVHRELRADNVFVADIAGYEYGFAKLLDFGVSRLTAAARAAGRIISPAALRALAPEQGQGVGFGDRADERTDQFALAVLTYRLLTGAEPFAGHERGPAFERLGENQTAAATAVIRCAPAVEGVLNKAMSTRPENRFDSVALFFRAFDEALTGRSAPSGPPAVRHDAPTVLIQVPAPAFVVGREAGARAAAPVFGIDKEAGERVRAGRAAEQGIDGDHFHASSQTLRATVVPVSSLTQQFFVEGDRQEASHRAHAEQVQADSFNEDGRSFDTTDRVPRRRAPLMAVALAVGFGIGAWATGMWSPFTWFAANADGIRFGAVPSPGVGSQRPAPVATVERTVPPAAFAVPVAAHALPVPAVLPPAVAPPSAVVPVVPAVPVTQGTPVVPGGTSSQVSPAFSGSPPAASEPVGPLRGHAWSPDRRRLIRSQLAPLPTESPPPPDMSPPARDMSPPPRDMSPPPPDMAPPPPTDPTPVAPSGSPPPSPIDSTLLAPSESNRGSESPTP